MARTERKADTTGDALLSRRGRLLAGLLVGWRCPVCARRINSGASKKTGLQMDHVTAHANGGGTVGNLIVLCGSCNASKCDAADLVVWLTKRAPAVGATKAETVAGIERAAVKIAAELHDLRDRLTAALISEGIWS